MNYINNNMKLSKREKDCINHIVEGRSIIATAKLLNLSPSTVKHYIQNIRNKVHSQNMAQTIYKIMQLNLL